jgi:hypothetical protein
MSIGKSDIIGYLVRAYSSRGMTGLEDAVEKGVLVCGAEKVVLDKQDTNFVMGVVDTLDACRKKSDFPSIWSLTYGPVMQQIEAIRY